MPTFVSNTSLCLGSGLLKIETRVSLASIGFCVKLNYSPQELIIQEHFCSPWCFLLVMDQIIN